MAGLEDEEDRLLLEVLCRIAPEEAEGDADASTLSTLQRLAARLRDPAATPRGLAVGAFLGLARSAQNGGQRLAPPILDVRSPGEFARGHIPGARSLPLFSDEERAAVGTTYKQKSREEAMLIGMSFVEPKLRALVERASAVAEANGKPEEVDLAVHCWRGGMRSGSVAWLLRRHGLRVATLAGGYKAFRGWVLDRWHGLTLPKPLARPSRDQMAEEGQSHCVPPATLEAVRALPGPRVCIIGGRTGVGKTRVLRALREQLGQPVLDLEALAVHRGSAFGWCGQGGLPQPSTEHFANLVAVEWDRTVQDGRPWVFIEDEDNHIGSCEVPAGLSAVMHCAPLLVRVGLGEEARVRLLLEDYAGPEAQGDDPQAWLARMEASVEQLRKRLGGALAKDILAKLRAQDYEAVARALLAYYDRQYDRQVASGAGTCLRPGIVLDVSQDPEQEQLDAVGLAREILGRVAEFEARESPAGTEAGGA